MLYIKYVALSVLYSVIASLIFIVIDVIMYPALLQGLIDKKLPFSVLVKDLYIDFTESKKEDRFHKIGASFLNSIASFGYQIAMLIYMIVLVVLYSLLGLFIFNVVTFGLASICDLINIPVLVHFFDFFNIIYESYAFIIIAFLISSYVSFKYHRYINERFELKKSSFADVLHALVRVIVFVLPAILVYIGCMGSSAVYNFIFFIGRAINVIDVFVLLADNVPAFLFQFTDNEVFVLCSVTSLILITLFDVGYTKRISNKANKKIMKDIKLKAKEQDQLVKVQEEDLHSAQEELASIKKTMETKIEPEIVEKKHATFIDLPEEETNEVVEEQETTSEQVKDKDTE